MKFGLLTLDCNSISDNWAFLIFFLKSHMILNCMIRTPTWVHVNYKSSSHDFSNILCSSIFNSVVCISFLLTHLLPCWLYQNDSSTQIHNPSWVPSILCGTYSTIYDQLDTLDPFDFYQSWNGLHKGSLSTLLNENTITVISLFCVRWLSPCI